jgi:hypothetical protein
MSIIKAPANSIISMSPGDSRDVIRSIFSFSIQGRVGPQLMAFARELRFRVFVGVAGLVCVIYLCLTYKSVGE